MVPIPATSSSPQSIVLAEPDDVYQTGKVQDLPLSLKEIVLLEAPPSHPVLIIVHPILQNLPSLEALYMGVDTFSDVRHITLPSLRKLSCTPGGFDSLIRRNSVADVGVWQQAGRPWAPDWSTVMDQLNEGLVPIRQLSFKQFKTLEKHDVPYFLSKIRSDFLELVSLEIAVEASEVSCCSIPEIVGLMLELTSFTFQIMTCGVALLDGLSSLRTLALHASKPEGFGPTQQQAALRELLVLLRQSQLEDLSFSERTSW